MHQNQGLDFCTLRTSLGSKNGEESSFFNLKYRTNTFFYFSLFFMVLSVIYASFQIFLSIWLAYGWYYLDILELIFVLLNSIIGVILIYLIRLNKMGNSLKWIYYLISFSYFFSLKIISKNIRIWVLRSFSSNYYNQSTGVLNLEILVRFLYVIFIDQNFLVFLSSELLFILDSYLTSVHFNAFYTTEFYNVLILDSVLSVFFYLHEKNTNSTFKKSENIFCQLNYFKKLFETSNNLIFLVNKDREVSCNKPNSSTIIENSSLSKLLVYYLQDIDVNPNLFQVFNNTSNFETIFKKTGNIQNDGTLSFNETSIRFNIKSLNESLDNVISFIHDNSTYFSKYRTLGNKTINKNKHDITYQINAKFSIEDQIIEFNFSDITDICRESQEKAMKAMKSIFLSKVTHEFKNPLINISELIHEVILNEELKGMNNSKTRTENEIKLNIVSPLNQNKKRSFDGLENLNCIKHLTNFMISLIKDFEFISAKSIQKDIETSKDKVIIEDLLVFCIEIFVTKSKLLSKNIEISYNIHDDVPECIISDETKLKQILINLLSNSFKFTNSGGILIEVSKSRDAFGEPSKESLKFSVIDSGIGISQSMIKSLISSSYKNDNENNNIYGIGLGLSLVKELIKLNSSINAKLQFDSTKNVGTNISFLIPLVEKTLNNKSNNFLSLNYHNLNRISENNKVGKSSLNRNSHEIVIKGMMSRSRTYAIETNFCDKNYNQKSFSCPIFPKVETVVENFEYQINTTDKNVLYENLDKEEEIIENPVELESNYSPIMKKKYKYSSTYLPPNFNFIEKLTLNNNKQLRTLSNKHSPETQMFKKLSANEMKFNDSFNLDKEKTYNIMIVEDETMIRNSHVRLFSSFFKKKETKVDIVECKDGAECLYYLYEGIRKGIKYDAIITDESMEFMRGSLLCGILHGLIKGSILYFVRIFMVTAYDKNNENLLGIREKIEDIFSKPLTGDVVEKICKKIN